MLSLPVLQPLEVEWARILSLRELLESKYVSILTSKNTTYFLDLRWMPSSTSSAILLE
jgi:hypothetical protein